tara:strand:- start:91 stop:489 length:399 start_codon:yes stop_codon:yes gene_type:complete
MKFTTTTNNDNIDFDYIGIEKFLKEILKLDFTEIEDVLQFARIDWEFYLETRSWGIKNFGAYATKISIDLTLEYYKTDLDNAFNLLSTEIEITKYIQDFTIESETEFNNEQHLSVGQIEINFDTRTITILFN